MKYPELIPFKTTKEQAEFLRSQENASAYIRQAIDRMRNKKTEGADKS